MKKLLALFLALCLICSLAGCGNTAPGSTTAPQTTAPTTAAVTEPTQETASSITPLLYQVTDGDGHTIWLFGSIHVGRMDFYPLPDYVTDAFNQAEALAVEFDIRAYEQDALAQADDLLSLTYLDDTTIEDHIDPELYAEASALLQDKSIPAALLKLYRPIYWSLLIEGLAYETDTTSTLLGVDSHMIDAAYERNIPVLSIESASSQYAMLANFSPELQEFCLRQAVDNAPYAFDSMVQLIDLWASGDEAAFCAYLNAEEEIPAAEVKLYEEYTKAMIIDRNLAMTDYAENLLKEGKPTMICVGAAHVVGEGAMAQMLQSRGYTVTEVSP